MKEVPSAPWVEVPDGWSFFGLENIWNCPWLHLFPNLSFTSWKHNITQREAGALELAHQSNRNEEAMEEQG